MEPAKLAAPTMTENAIRAVNEILHRRNQAEIKVEKGEVVVIEIRRTKRA